MSQIKILHIISSSGFYGAENVVLNLMTASKKDGAEPYLICLKSKQKETPQLYDEARKRDIASYVFSCNGKLDIGTIFKIKGFITKNNIQIIHSHGYKSNLYAFIAAKITNTPIVSTAHGWTSENRKVRFYETLDKWIIKNMNHLIIVSPSMNITGKNVSYIPNGIDTTKFSPNGTKSKSNDIVIGAVGRLTPEKGHIYLINAFKEIGSINPNVKLVIVGDGYLRESLGLRVDSLELQNRVIFAGLQKDMVSVYKKMDIFVLPSLTEGLPLALLEAMSMELPVIATKVGAVTDVLDNDEGILVSSGSSEELKKALTLLINNKNLREEISQRARSKVVSCFSFDNSYQQYITVYRNILNKNGNN